MTKVETERNNCIFALLLAQKGAVADVVTEEMNKSLAALISASHAEGVAEGEEKMRLRVIEESDGFAAGVTVNDSEHISTDWEGTCTADCELYVVPASVLAPKESPHSQWHDSVIEQKEKP
jgi:hypothetical protein